MAKEKVKEKGVETVDLKIYAAQFLNANKEHHYNDVSDSRGGTKISTGSLKFDYVTGGIAPGCVFVTGPKESGKTSFILSCMKNMFATIPDSRGLFVAAERPLTEEMQKRSGIKFVRDPEEWEVGTCLIFESIVFEVVFSFIRNLVLMSKKTGDVFCFAIDSSNALIKKEDLEKGFEDAQKVAGGALITADFLRRVSLPMGKLGHYCFMTGQDRAEIKVSQYAKGNRNQIGRATGGNALPHYSLWCFDFQRVTKADLIEKDGKIIGHNVKVKFEKSPNDTTQEVVEYPVIRKRGDGKSIWAEREIVDMFMLWDILIKKGAWIEIDGDLLAFMAKEGVPIESQYNGKEKIYQYLEGTKGAVEAFFKYFKRFSV